MQHQQGQYGHTCIRDQLSVEGIGDGEMVTLDQDEEGGDDQLGVPGPQPRAEVGVQAVQLAAQRVHVVPGQQRQGGVLLLSSNSIREYIGFVNNMSGFT